MSTTKIAQKMRYKHLVVDPGYGKRETKKYGVGAGFIESDLTHMPIQDTCARKTDPLEMHITAAKKSILESMIYFHPYIELPVQWKIPGVAYAPKQPQDKFEAAERSNKWGVALDRLKTVHLGDIKLTKCSKFELLSFISSGASDLGGRQRACDAWATRMREAQAAKTLMGPPAKKARID